jgi:hypothetical protein
MKTVNKLLPFLVKIELYILFFTIIIWNRNVDFLLVSIDFLVFLLSFLCIGLLGYFSNDLADQKSDFLVGKINLASDLNLTKKTLIFLVLLIVGVLPISIYSPKVFPFILSEIVLILIYAFPPFRLKEKGLFGVLADSIYAYLLPTIIVLVYLNCTIAVDRFFWFFLTGFSFAIGVRNIINHQIEDFDNDLISNTKTFATENIELAQKIVTIFTVTNCLFFILSGIYINFYQIENLKYLQILFGIISLVFTFKLCMFFSYRELRYLTSLPESDFIFYGLLSIVYELIYLSNWVFLIFVPLFFTPIFSAKLVKVYWLVFRVCSLIVNYSLYYSFLIFRVDLKARAEKKKNDLLRIGRNEISPLVKVNEKNVNGLWIGNELSLMELLTIESFIANGYTFHLWTYEPIKTNLPKSCICCDANQIIPLNQVFKYKYSSQFGTGKGSYAGFSDIFRYKLLHDQGGWWVDMDVTCIKPFDVEVPYFFREHHSLPLVGNVMKAPKGSELMWKCYQDASLAIDENNRDWHKPIEILIKNIQEFDLGKHVVSSVSNTDEWHKIKGFVYGNEIIPNNWVFIHWCNEVWRTNGFSKNQPLNTSTYGKLLMKHNRVPSLDDKTSKLRDRPQKLKLFLDKIFDFL